MSSSCVAGIMHENVMSSACVVGDIYVRENGMSSSYVVRDMYEILLCPVHV